MCSNPNQSHDPDDRPSTPSSPLREARAFLEDESVNNELLSIFKDTFGAEPQTSPASSADRNRALGLKTLVENENKIKVFEHVLGKNDPCVEATVEFMDKLDKTEAAFNQLELSTLLGEAQKFVNAGDDNEAEKKVKSAIEVARRMNSEIDTARVWFWMGRVEFLRGNMAEARRHFEAAKPCAADDEERVECLDIQFYQDITREGINYETRIARLDAYQKLINADLPYNVALINSIQVDDKQTQALKTTTAMINSLRVEEKETRAPKSTTAIPFAPGVIRVDRSSRKYLKVRRPVPKVPQTGKGESNHATTSDMSTEVPSKDTKSKNTNTLGKALGEALTEELGYKPKATDNGTVMDSTKESTANPKLVDTDKSTAKATLMLFNSSANPKITEPNKAPTKLPASGGPGLSQGRYQKVQQQERINQTQQRHFRTDLSDHPAEPFVFGEPHTSTPQTQFRVGCTHVGRAVQGRPGTIFRIPLPDEVQISHEEAKLRDEFNARKVVSYEYMEMEKNWLDMTP